MNIVCPNCNAQIDSATLTPGGEFVCTACGSNVQITGGSTAAFSDSQGPRRMGKFDLLDVVGSGGFGTVYKARDAELDRIVAVKVPHPGRIASAGDSDRFLREARSVASLRHPSIVSVLEVGRQDGVPFLVEDFVDGITLSDFLTDDRPDPRTTAELVAKMADALQFAHAGGVVHRDIKPSNIMLELVNGDSSKQYQPRLMDFGLAKREGVDVTMTIEGQVIGTPAYMSPEQARGEGHHVDGRTDIYSLGVILYQMLTGQLPFKGNARMLLHHVLHDEPKPPRKLSPQIPRDLETICLKAMAKEANRRYQTAGELAADLRRFLGGEPILARRVGGVERLVKWVRRKPAHASMAAMFVVMIAGTLGVGGWLWHVERKRANTAPPENGENRLDVSNEVKTQFYLNAVRRRGVFEGIWPLTDEQARHAGRSYRFHTRAGRVEKVEVLQSGETPIDNDSGTSSMSTSYFTDPQQNVERRRECRYEYRYNDRGQASEEIAYDQRGKIIWVFHYTSHSAEQSAGYFTDSRGFPRARTGSGASYIEFKWTPEGFEKEVRYLDRLGRPLGLPDGTWGIVKEVDSRGLPTKLTYIGYNGKPAFQRVMQYSTIKTVFDERGTRIEQSYFDPDGKPVNHLNGWGHHRLLLRVDELGNRREWRFYGVDGKPTVQVGWAAHWVLSVDDRGREIGGRDLGPNDEPWGSVTGVFQWRQVLDERGYPIEFHTLDQHGKPMFGKNQVAVWKAKRDAFGMPTQWESFGLDGKRMVDSNRVSFSMQKLDDDGNQIEWSAFDTNGKPTRDSKGVSIYRSKFDAQGRRLELAVFGPDGKPTLHDEGWHRVRDSFDDRGNLLETHYFGRDGNLILRKGGYAKVTRTYDDRGLLIEMASFGVNGEPVLENGYAKLRYVYDLRGLETERTSIGIDGKPTISEWGYATWHQRRNDRGWIIEQWYLDANGKPVSHKNSGVERMKFAYDQWGRVTDEAFFDFNGKPTLHMNGYARGVSRYNERGRLVEVRFLGLDGRLTLHRESRIAGRRLSYDALGWVNEESYFGIDEKPALHRDGFSRLSMIKDSFGRLLEGRYFGLDGKPVNRVGGYAMIAARLDPYGNRVAEDCFLADGQLGNTEETYCKANFEHDDRDNQTLVRFLDKNGRPVAIGNTGAFAMTMSYDERGNRIEERILGADGELRRPGASRTVHVFDANDRQIEVTWFQADGSRGLSRDGWWKQKIDFDARGRKIKESHFGVDDKPILRRDGWSLALTAYDDRGNETGVAYFGVDGKPVIMNDGFARMSSKYDQRDKNIEIEFFDAAGKLVKPKIGQFPRIVREYDQHGMLVSEAYFGVDNKPMASPQGPAKVTVQYDEHRRFRTQISNFGGDDKPIRGSAGWARATFAHDPDGEQVKRAFFDVDGKEMQVRVYIAQVNRGSMAQKLGIKVGDELVTFDQRPVTSTASIPNNRSAPAELVFSRDGKQQTVVVPPGVIGIVLGERVLPGK